MRKPLQVPLYVDLPSLPQGISDQWTKPPRLNNKTATEMTQPTLLLVGPVRSNERESIKESFHTR